MDGLSNSLLVKLTLEALYTVGGRRTSLQFADETIGSTIRTLEGKYDFLRHVKVNKTTLTDKNFDGIVSPEVNSLSSEMVGKALESIIRMVYTDLNKEAGLYFITELKEFAGKKVVNAISNCDVDLDQVQVEQHYLYRRQERKNGLKGGGKPGEQKKPNLLGYSWSSVAKWKHEPGSKFCVLYNEHGEVLDRLNLDRIIQNYVERLSGNEDGIPASLDKEVRIYEKEYALLELMHSQDMDAETAASLLQVSPNELNDMIRKLSQVEMLQFTAYDTVELTKKGISYISKGDQKK